MMLRFILASAIVVEGSVLKESSAYSPIIQVPSVAAKPNRRLRISDKQPSNFNDSSLHLTSLRSHNVIATSGPWYGALPMGVGAIASPESLGAEFRGSFRDLSLWIRRDAPPANDVWVMEFDDPDAMAKDRAWVEKLGLKVLMQEKLSLVIQGRLDDDLAYDSVNGRKSNTLIRVSDGEVIVREMAATDQAKYMAMARKRDEQIAGLIGRVTQPDLEKLITQLQSYQTRNTYSRENKNGLNQAADWAATKLRDYGFSVRRDTWKSGVTPSVIAELRGKDDPDRLVVLGAHLDSRQIYYNSATKRAPGADDNGSGSATVLEFAKVVSESRSRFKHTLVLCLFTGEEQGSKGSHALATRWKKEGRDIAGMINVDMIGFKMPLAPITFTLAKRSVDEKLNSIVMRVVNTYMPNVATGYTTTCCSDQQSFYENGFPAVSIFETPGSTVINPHYHEPDDLLKYLDLEQIQVHGSVAMATAALLAQIVH